MILIFRFYILGISLVVLLMNSCTKKAPNPYTMEKATYQYRSQEFEKAIKILHHLDDSLFCERESLLGNSYNNLEQFKKSIQHYRHFLDSCSPHISALNNLCNAYNNLEQLDSAYFYIQKAYKLNPKHPVTNFNIGGIHYEKGEDSLAMHYLQKAIKLSRYTDFDSFVLISELNTKAKNHEASFALIDTMIRKAKHKDNGDYEHALLERAYLYSDINEWQKMRDEIDTILSHHTVLVSDFIQARYNRYICNINLMDTISACRDYNFLMNNRFMEFEDLEMVFDCPIP